ncbi:MAG: ABC transporter ATP-binding protein [Calditrichaeota bacterium]|nr:ABC transporter ATP-binding protein [Calditrichota bacterium]
MGLEIKNLRKEYKNGVKAIDNLNLTIANGMFGLLGPNGAGKSSLMRTIATLQSVDSGSLYFNGIDVLNDPISLRKVLGYLPQEFGVYPGVTADELLNYFARLKGLQDPAQRRSKINQVLELTNLTADRDKHVHSYSGGMLQRFGIAQLLLNQPNLIIVDEPTAGLDPAERRRFLNILREIGSENTVIFSTHIVDDVRELCHDMAILNHGRIISHSRPETAIASLEGQIWSRSVAADQLQSLQKQYTVLSSQFNQDNSLSVRVYSPQQPSPEFFPVKADLDDVYFCALNESAGLPHV